MDIRFNGQPLTVPLPLSITGLLERQGLGGRRVAVEVNGAIIPRGQHATHMLAPGDAVEVVHALGGG
jgi:sulfur carrier protein